MKFTQYDYERLRCQKVNIQSDMTGLLEGFVNSELKCAKVEGYPHKSVSTFASSMRRCIKTNHYYSVKVVVRKDEVFLINTSID